LFHHAILITNGRSENYVNQQKKFSVASATVPVGKPAKLSKGNMTNEARAQPGAAFRVLFPGPSQVPPTGAR